MKLDNKTLFMTGSNRGIGKALVEALLKHPVRKIYAAARRPQDLPAFNDSRVVPIKLDIGDPIQIQQAVTQAQDQARHYFSRKQKWDPSDFSFREKSRGG